MRLTRFGFLPITYYNQVEPIGSGDTPTSYFNLPEGGAIDLFGSARKRPGMIERVKSMRISAKDTLDLEQKYFEIMAMVGTRDKLYRELASGEIQWMYARLKSLAAVQTYELTKFKKLLDVDLAFELQEAYWRGRYYGSFVLDAGYLLDDGNNLDSGASFPLDVSPKYVVINVGPTGVAGVAPTSMIKLVVSAGSAAITSITIERVGGEKLIYSGVIAAGSSLIIDCSVNLLTIPSVADPYQYLVISPTADQGKWFSLLPGSNTVKITFAGGGTGSTIEIQRTELWF